MNFVNASWETLVLIVSAYWSILDVQYSSRFCAVTKGCVSFNYPTFMEGSFSGRFSIADVRVLEYVRCVMSECSSSWMTTQCCRCVSVLLSVFQSQHHNTILFSIHARGFLPFCTNSAIKLRATCIRCWIRKHPPPKKKTTEMALAHVSNQKLPIPKYQQNWRNVNLQDADGESPLHKAARFGDAKTARSFFLVT